MNQMEQQNTVRTNQSLSALVIMPTYNEADNAQKIINAILGQGSNFSILIIDDNSPDGTADIVREMQKNEPRIHLLTRPGKMGLGTAYVVGFKYALTKPFDRIFEMDADFSHDPAELPAMMELSRSSDVVIGSRYSNGVNVVNWPMKRLLLSYFANQYTRFVTGVPVNDATSGFVCWSREVLQALNLDNIRSSGYSFQIEMKFKAWLKGYTIAEHPIIFVDRRVGVSKMSQEIVYEAAWRVWKLKLQSLLNGPGAF